ncbi:MAG: efflux RND transporter permease subunit, partial [Thiohalorhabdaceae bacterium]
QVRIRSVRGSNQGYLHESHLIPSGLYQEGVISVATLIGFIALFGIATRNGVMLVSHIHTLREQEGEGPRGAVRRATLERLVPILMTALSAGLGLLPLALSAGQPGSEIQAPMAMVILFGLVSSTVLNMVVLPALYLRFGGAARRSGERGNP